MQKRMPMVSAEECIFVHKKEPVLASPFCVTFFFLSRSFLWRALSHSHCAVCTETIFVLFFSSSFCLLFRGFWWMQTERCIDTYGAQNARARDFRAILFMRFLAVRIILLLNERTKLRNMGFAHTLICARVF